MGYKVSFLKQSDFIRWVQPEEMARTSRAFRSHSGFPGIILVIDGCHIRIHPPIENQKAYLNYKRFHSIVLIICVLPDKSFSYVFSGFPGSSHDSYIFQRSPLFQKMHADVENGSFDDSRYHILGDSGFPLKSWLLIPYKWFNELDADETLFNAKLSGTRSLVERGLGDLQNRFRRIVDIDASIEHAVDIVVASCVIQKICIQQGDFIVEYDRTLPPPNFDVNPNPQNDLRDLNGEVKRRAIIRVLRNRPNVR